MKAISETRPTPEDILAIEQILGLKLPEEYLDFLNRFNGAYFDAMVVIELCDGSDADVREIYGVGPTVPSTSNLETTLAWKDWSDAKVQAKLPPRNLRIPIGNDSGAQMFWLSLAPESYGDIYYQHKNLEKLTGKIASSFDDFLSRLEDSE